MSEVKGFIHISLIYCQMYMLQQNAPKKKKEFKSKEGIKTDKLLCVQSNWGSGHKTHGCFMKRQELRLLLSCCQGEDTLEYLPVKSWCPPNTRQKPEQYSDISYTEDLDILTPIIIFTMLKVDQLWLLALKNTHLCCDWTEQDCST